jgi:hypothetical protein
MLLFPKTNSKLVYCYVQIWGSKEHDEQWRHRNVGFCIYKIPFRVIVQNVKILILNEYTITAVTCKWRGCHIVTKDLRLSANADPVSV